MSVMTGSIRRNFRWDEPACTRLLMSFMSASPIPVSSVSDLSQLRLAFLMPRIAAFHCGVDGYTVFSIRIDIVLFSLSFQQTAF